MTKNLSFEIDGATIQCAELLPIGADVIPLEWELSKANMMWDKRIQFDPTFANLLLPTWTRVTKQLGEPNPLPEESY